MKVIVLDPGIPLGKGPFIKRLSYDLETLLISVNPDTEGSLIEVTFEQPRGFRCLDEGDMLNYWTERIVLDNWFFEVLEGGWMDHEATRDGFISKTFGYREFLICGIDDCVSVLSKAPPLFRVVD
jgi:hypothetical protein